MAITRRLLLVAIVGAGLSGCTHDYSELQAMEGQFDPVAESSCLAEVQATPSFPLVAAAESSVGEVRLLWQRYAPQMEMPVNLGVDRDGTDPAFLCIFGGARDVGMRGDRVVMYVLEPGQSAWVTSY